MHNRILLYSEKYTHKNTGRHSVQHSRTHTHTLTKTAPLLQSHLLEIRRTAVGWLAGLDSLSCTPFLCAVRWRRREQRRGETEEPPVANKNCTALASNWRECKLTQCEQPTRERRTRVAWLPGGLPACLPDCPSVPVHSYLLAYKHHLLHAHNCPHAASPPSNTVLWITLFFFLLLCVCVCISLCVFCTRLTA